MKFKFLPAALLVAGVTLAPGLARAVEPVVSYSSGDLILGFQLSGDNDLEVDLGAYTKFLNATSPFNITFGVVPADQSGAGATVTNLAADLVANYGSGWASNSGTSLLQWGVVGAIPSGSSYTSFFTIDSNNPTVPARASNGQGSNIGNAVDLSLGNTLKSDFSTVNSTVAASVGSTSPNSWTSFSPGTSGFGTGFPNEQQFGVDGPTNSTLNLFQDVPNGRNGGGGSAVDVGAFTLDNAGELTFTPAAVPEPATWLSLIAGALFLVLFRRRGIHTP